MKSSTNYFQISYFMCISASLSTKQIHSCCFFFQKNEYLGRYIGICEELSCKKCFWGCKIPSKQNTNVCHQQNNISKSSSNLFPSELCLLILGLGKKISSLISRAYNPLK